MTKEPAELEMHATPAWLVEWLGTASRRVHGQSLALIMPENGPVELVKDITSYLNEFDSYCESSWRLFDSGLLRSLADHGPSRRIVLSEREDPEQDSAWSRADRIARRLANLGGVILQGPESWDATTDLANIFRVLLHDDERDPQTWKKSHMTINLQEFPSQRLVSIIADSFLEWRRLEPASDMSEAV